MDQSAAPTAVHLTHDSQLLDVFQLYTVNYRAGLGIQYCEKMLARGALPIHDSWVPFVNFSLRLIHLLKIHELISSILSICNVLLS